MKKENQIHYVKRQSQGRRHIVLKGSKNRIGKGWCRHPRPDRKSGQMILRKSQHFSRAEVNKLDFTEEKIINK